MGSNDNVSLPPGTSPDLRLVTPTLAERLECWRSNGEDWRGPVSLDQYLRREQLLENQDMTRDGGLSGWILVDRNEPPNARTILCSCETYAKPAWVARDGCIEDVLAHTVGSVFCRPEYRGRGYAKRMLAELANVLDSYQQKEKKDSDRGRAAGTKRAVFSTLYSDIGKEFYGTHGWRPFEASHITLHPIPQPSATTTANGHAPVDMTLVKDMGTQDVKRNMCSDTILEKLRRILKSASKSEGRTKVAIAPDYAHMCWHWAREEFYIDILCPEKGRPTVKGAGVPSRGVYLCWNRRYGMTEKDRTLYILRVVYDELTSPEERHTAVQAVAAALRRAQIEAHVWDMTHVEIWNPSPLIQEAVKRLDHEAEVVHRNSAHIPCLRWGGEELGLGKEDEVDWAWNERYAWC